MKEYYISKSHKISDLDAKDDILSSDLFVISQENTRANRVNNYITKSLKMGDFENQVYGDLSTAFHLSSMAFKDTWEYSRVNHTHTFTKITVDSKYKDMKDSEVSCLASFRIGGDYLSDFVVKINDSDLKDHKVMIGDDPLSIRTVHVYTKEERGDNLSNYIFESYNPKSKETIRIPGENINDYDIKIDDDCLSNFNVKVIDTNIINVNIPKIVYPPYPEPDIGEMRLITTKKLHDLSGFQWEGSTRRFDRHSALSFDGWVYPDGSSFFRDDFPKAAEVYGNPGSSTFSVPTLSNFFKLNPGIEKNDPMKKVGYNLSIKEHKHTVSKSENKREGGVLSCAVNVPCKGNGDGTPGHVHRGQGAYNNTVEGITIEQLDVSMFNCSVEAVSEPLDKSDNPVSREGEPYPTHNLMPAMIYIGRILK